MIRLLPCAVVALLLAACAGNSSPSYQIGGWSGFPVVIGDPASPEAIAGAMWYRSNIDAGMGGAASTRMLKRWLGRLRLADFSSTR